MKATPAITIATLALLILLAAAFQSSAQRTPPSDSGQNVRPLLKRVVESTAEERELPSAADSSPNAMTDEDQARTRREFVRTADFYLRDGGLVFGRVIEDDRNKIIVEQLEDSTVVAATYSRKQIEPRSIQIKNVPASTFYMERGDYFAGRTWDFKNDPDDFILAIRAYERAKRTTDTSSELGLARVRTIEDKIKALQEDRKVWAREIEGRAKQKELEFQAEYVSRFKELADQIDATKQNLQETITQVEQSLSQTNEQQQTIQQNLATMQQDVQRQLAMMAEQIEAMRRDVNPYYRPPLYRYRNY